LEDQKEVKGCMELAQDHDQCPTLVLNDVDPSFGKRSQ